ncbi:hypothetical protein ACLB2K_059075 [Fragaria x ananassa]
MTADLRCALGLAAATHPGRSLLVDPRKDGVFDMRREESALLSLDMAAATTVVLRWRGWVMAVEKDMASSTCVLGLKRYYLTSKLNEKSDVYSFGIVLLEIITSRPVIWGTVERIHISHWVASMLAQGDIYSTCDTVEI